MQALGGRLLQALYPMLEEDSAYMTQQEQSHRNTLDVLRRIVKGELDPKMVVVSDDGWQIMPEMPSD